MYMDWTTAGDTNPSRRAVVFTFSENETLRNSGTSQCSAWPTLLSDTCLSTCRREEKKSRSVVGRQFSPVRSTRQHWSLTKHKAALSDGHQLEGRDPTALRGARSRKIFDNT
ncbi:hypothetical protein E2C01_004756 [Portunus trituberculatus]|uniref:Uncharacterized protein n=1 Tax=Portunus trituberculatus TaxID=210409 RepID=A0A5B7CRE4_PORTR|nr:hypothetical protein [Portunus trituberculatus]